MEEYKETTAYQDVADARRAEVRAWLTETPGDRVATLVATPDSVTFTVDAGRLEEAVQLLEKKRHNHEEGTHGKPSENP